MSLASMKDPKCLKIKGAQYLLIDAELFKKFVTTIYLRCVRESKIIILEVHSNECAGHYEGRTLANRILRHGYF